MVQGRVGSSRAAIIRGFHKYDGRATRYNVRVARGWESKSVEAQQADHEAPRNKSASVAPDEAARIARRRTLEMARALAVRDLSVAHVPAHRAMLQASIEAIDRQLAALAAVQ